MFLDKLKNFRKPPVKAEAESDNIHIEEPESFDEDNELHSDSEGPAGAETRHKENGLTSKPGALVKRKVPVRILPVIMAFASAFILTAVVCAIDRPAPAPVKELPQVALKQTDTARPSISEGDPFAKKDAAKLGLPVPPVVQGAKGGQVSGGQGAAVVQKQDKVEVVGLIPPNCALVSINGKTSVVKAYTTVKGNEIGSISSDGVVVNGQFVEYGRQEKK